MSRAEECLYLLGVLRFKLAARFCVYNDTSTERLVLNGC